MTILVTGAAGFIGAAVVEKICSCGPENVKITGIDNINDYYTRLLKFARLRHLGIKPAADGLIPNELSDAGFPWLTPIKSERFPNFSFIRINLEDDAAISDLFEKDKFDMVIHLAGQAGVRHSISNPKDYITSNITGFLNVLEGCRKTRVKHLVYASSSSVYGLNGKTPFSEKDSVAHPVSLYAATKKADELMAHAYSHLYDIPTTGLRFFTVYGPWGRPDMSPYLFMDAIINNKPIKLFNSGDMLRDFTYIDDVTEAVVRTMNKIPEGDPNWDAANPDPSTSSAPFRIINIGNSSPVNLHDYISGIETAIGKTADKISMPMQPGDIYQTYSDSTTLFHLTGFKPTTSLQDGIKRTVEWFKDFKASYPN